MYKKFIVISLFFLAIALIVGTLRLELSTHVNAQEEELRRLEIDEYVLLNNDNPWLVDIDLRNTRLDLIDLSNANLRYSDFTNSEMQSANLQEAEIEMANFDGTNLEEATLDRVKISNTSFIGADLSNSSWIDADVSTSNFTNANLSGGIFRKTNFSGSDFINATITGAILEGANLTGANLSGSNLSNASLSGANLGGADFTDAEINQNTVFNNSCFSESTRWSEGFGQIEALVLGAEFANSCSTEESSSNSTQNTSINPSYLEVTNPLYLAFPNPLAFTESSNMTVQLLSTLDSWSSTNSSTAFNVRITPFPFVAAGENSQTFRDLVQNSGQLEDIPNYFQVNFESYYAELYLPEGNNILSIVFETIDGARIPQFGGGCTIIVGDSSFTENVFDPDTAIKLTDRDNFIDQFAQKYRTLAGYAYDLSTANVANCDCDLNGCGSGCPGTLGGPGCKNQEE